MSAARRCVSASQAVQREHSAAACAGLAAREAEPRKSRRVMRCVLPGAFVRARAQVRREAQHALYRGARALRPSSGAVRMRACVPLGPGSHNQLLERTASGALRAPAASAQRQR
jgi:hypothetical protein